ncbi:phenylalanine--tRNA ligase subunit beta [soil metagenome]
MTISYNWLRNYLPEDLQKIELEKLSNILTSVGLEVESMEKYEEIKGSLEGLLIGEVKECIKHPEADKLSLTKVDIGTGELLQIVCGAPNVAAGQKVVVAPVGSTIYPASGEPMSMKKAKIRGQESQGMICAEDEIGVGTGHAGIMILPDHLQTGSAASDYFKPYIDWIYEIGLTPNRMDAMSHLGVAKDVCAYIQHNEKITAEVVSPLGKEFYTENNNFPLKVIVENNAACPRYSGVTIAGLAIAESPEWLQQKLKSIGVKPINNVVDITNFVLHETGQPLHAFDAERIAGNVIIVKNLPEGTSFLSLDEKERKLSENDLMICDGDQQPMCIGGVFGGKISGISTATTSIFLESAFFDPSTIRRTSVRHGLRTDAATHFEKGVDISNTVDVLKRAAALIKEVAGGKISSEIIDIYPVPIAKTEITFSFDYLTKISGKQYAPETIKNILISLGFQIKNETTEGIIVAVPHKNPDIKIPADIVEEIMRIDGLDNVAIPSAIFIAPSPDPLAFENSLKEKLSQYLVGSGVTEIFTNSITNSAYFSEDTLSSTVKILNSLSIELDVMKPTMLHTALETVAHNLNRKNNDLRFFEFGKTYSLTGNGFSETDHLSIYVSGNKNVHSWNQKLAKADIYFLKGICEKIFLSAGINKVTFTTSDNISGELVIKIGKRDAGAISIVAKSTLEIFSIKQPVYYADLFWDMIIQEAKRKNIVYEPVSKFPTVHRDLSILVDRKVTFDQVQKVTKAANIPRLASTRLFDVFESDKLGEGKKSFAVSFTFFDNEKTLTDKEIDGMVNRLIQFYEKDINAEIRKS